MPLDPVTTGASRNSTWLKRGLCWLFPGLPLLVAILILALEVRFQRLVGADNSLDNFARVERGQPWGGYAWRVMSRSAAALWSRDPDLSARVLDSTVRRYPMESAQWLALARMAAAGPAADLEQMTARLELAVAIQPSDRSVLWEAAQLAIQARADNAAESLLRRWLQGYPDDTRQALFMAGRWLADPDQLVLRLLPDDPEHHAQAMQHAVQRKDLALAEAVFRRAAPARDLSDPVFRGLVSLLLAHGDIDRAAMLWAAIDPHYDRQGIANGGFDRELARAGDLEWRHAGLPQGVSISRDPDHHHQPPASLRFSFDGTANVILRNRAQIQVPVQPGQRYRLGGFWQGRALTTRALPYLHIDGLAGGAAQLPVPGKEFDWRPWSHEFRTGEQTRLLTLAVRRDRSPAFDNRISGDLWLDSIRLERLPDPAGTAAAGAIGGEYR